MEGDADCLWEQPRDHARWEMVGEGHRVNLSHLVLSPLGCWLRDVTTLRRVAAGPAAVRMKGTS